MRTDLKCPHCGLPLLPALVEGTPEYATVAELTREITLLRDTVARLRGSGFTGPPAHGAGGSHEARPNGLGPTRGETGRAG